MDDIDDIDPPFASLKADEIDPVATPSSDGELVLPVSANAPPMPHKHFDASTRWCYRDATGAVLFWILRFEKPGGVKEFWPLTLWRDTQGLHWRWKSVPAPRPLYNLDKLAQRPDATVVVCEGEKSADAASLIFPKAVATTSPGGANAADKADWSVLRGRKVLIWPDDDTPGRTYAAKVGKILAALGCEVSVIDAAALARTAPDGGKREPTKHGWDAVDAITEWADMAALERSGVACAKPFDAAENAQFYVSFGKYKMNADGLYTEVKRGRRDNSTIEIVRVSASFEILGLGRDPHGRAWGRFLRWRDLDGRTHEKFVADEVLQAEVAAICAPLAADGLQIVRSKQRELANYLSGAQTTARVTVVHRTGWHEIAGESVFVLPSESISRKSVGRVLLDGTAHGPYEAKGTLAEWQDGVATLTADHIIPMLVISTAFAGPLLYLAGLEGGGLNLFGQSSRGKTTCLQAAASVWGRGEKENGGYVRTWRATANGQEGAAAQSNDTLMVLDELGQLDAREAQQAVYMLANGQGKQRAAKDGSARDPKSWRALYLSSGELPVDAKLAETPGCKAQDLEYLTTADQTMMPALSRSPLSRRRLPSTGQLALNSSDD
jgi:putative DNA primase/helicase